MTVYRCQFTFPAKEFGCLGGAGKCGLGCVICNTYFRHRPGCLPTDRVRVATDALAHLPAKA